MLNLVKASLRPLHNLLRGRISGLRCSLCSSTGPLLNLNFDRSRQLCRGLSLAVFCAWAFFSAPVFAQGILRLSTTTSTENSGLLKFLLPAFEAESKINIQVIAVGSGKALELAKNGDVDVALVHAREAEDQFVAAAYGVYRHDVMFNDFVIVGPEHDPASVRSTKDVLSGLKRIVDQKARFVSRGDRSGTEMMEQSYWKLLGQKPIAPAYVSAGLGMGEVLSMAAELQAYTLSDRATFAAHKNGAIKSNLQIVLEGDTRMRNPYGVIAVNPARYPDINYQGAKKFIDWLCSEAGQKRIAAFRVDGAQVFFPHDSYASAGGTQGGRVKQ